MLMFLIAQQKIVLDVTKVYIYFFPITEDHVIQGIPQKKRVGREVSFSVHLPYDIISNSFAIL